MSIPKQTEAEGQKKILVAVDCSPHTVNTVNYLSSLFAGMAGVCFELATLVKSGQNELTASWQGPEGSIDRLSAKARSECDQARVCLERTAGRMQRAGIAPERISISVVPCTGEIAAALAAYAEKGMYDAVAVGRRGLGKLEEIMLGSVSTGLLDRCHSVPIWIIDGEVDSNRFLLPVDGSFHSLMAADHLGHIIADHPKAEVTLFHSSSMFASEPDPAPVELHRVFGRQWCEEHLGRPDSLFHGPRQVLVDHGFPRDRIKWLHTFRGIEPSRQIIRQALIDEYGTIVMGRRGGNIGKGLFRGVSDRVLYMAEKVAVWVVG